VSPGQFRRRPSGAGRDNGRDDFGTPYREVVVALDDVELDRSTNPLGRGDEIPDIAERGDVIGGTVDEQCRDVRGEQVRTRTMIDDYAFERAVVAGPCVTGPVTRDRSGEIADKTWREKITRGRIRHIV
jgi:hypothetical protein